MSEHQNIVILLVQKHRYLYILIPVVNPVCTVSAFCRNFKSLVQTVQWFFLRPWLSIWVLTLTISPLYCYRSHCQNQVLSSTTVGKLSRQFLVHSYRQYILQNHSGNWSRKCLLMNCQEFLMSIVCPFFIFHSWFVHMRFLYSGQIWPGWLELCCLI